MTLMGKHLEPDEYRRLAAHVIARAVEDATRYNAGELSGHLTHATGQSAIAFLTGKDALNLSSRAWWCMVAGGDYCPDAIRSQMMRVLADKRVIRISEYRGQEVDEERLADDTEYDICDWDDPFFDDEEWFEGLDDEAEDDIQDC